MTQPTAATPSRRVRAFAVYPLLFAAYPCCSCGRRTWARRTPATCSVARSRAGGDRPRDRPRARVPRRTPSGAGRHPVARRPADVRPRPDAGEPSTCGRSSSRPAGRPRVVAGIAADPPRRRRLATIDWRSTGSAPSSWLSTLVLIVPFQVTSRSCRAPTLDRRAVPGTTTTAAKRDVYWFVLDRYGSDRALQPGTASTTTCRHG